MHVAAKWAVIDVGVPAYAELYGGTPPPRRFEGQVSLGSDDDFYHEKGTREFDAPPLIFDWRIHRIEAERSPLVLINGNWTHDPARQHVEEVQEARGSDIFYLHCERLPGAPRRSR